MNDSHRAAAHAARRSPGRRAWLKRGAALALASLGAGARAQAQAGLRIGFIGAGKAPAAATGWAFETGVLQREFAALGIANVRFTAFPNGPDLNEALGGGALDAGVYGDTPAVVARSRGFLTRLIGFEQVGLNAWLLTPKDGAKSLEALKGKTVATALGSYMHRYLIGTLKEAGHTIGYGGTRVVYLLGKDAEPALARGDIAAFAAQIEVGPLLASRGYPVIDEANRHPSLVGSSVIVATEATLARFRGLPEAWNRARRAALVEIRADAERYYAFHARATGFPLEAVRASYPLNQFPDEAFPARGLELIGGTKSFLLGEKLAQADFEIRQWQAG